MRRRKRREEIREGKRWEKERGEEGGRRKGEGVCVGGVLFVIWQIGRWKGRRRQEEAREKHSVNDVLVYCITKREQVM